MNKELEEEIEKASKSYAKNNTPSGNSFRDSFEDFTNGAEFILSKFAFKKIDPDNLPKERCIVRRGNDLFVGYFSVELGHVYVYDHGQIWNLDSYLPLSLILKLDRE